MYRAYKNARYFDPKKDDVQSVAGNYIIIKCSENVYAGLVHLQTGSVQVSVGQKVKKGDVIGRVKELREKRDNKKVMAALKKVKQAAENNENTIPALIEAVKAYATVGEMADALREVYGTYEDPAVF